MDPLTPPNRSQRNLESDTFSSTSTKAGNPQDKSHSRSRVGSGSGGSKKRKRTSSTPRQRSSVEQDTDYQPQNEDSDSEAQTIETPTKTRTFSRSSRIVNEPAYRPSTSEDEGEANERPRPLTRSRNKDQYYVQPQIETPPLAEKQKPKSSRLLTSARHDLFMKYASQPATDYEAALWEAYTAYVKGITPPPTNASQTIMSTIDSHAPNSISIALTPQTTIKTLVQIVNELGVKKEERASSSDIKQEKYIKREVGITEEHIKEEYIEGSSCKHDEVKKEADFDSETISKGLESCEGKEKQGSENLQDVRSLCSIDGTQNLVSVQHRLSSSNSPSIPSSRKRVTTDMSLKSHMFTVIQSNGCARHIYYCSDTFGFVDIDSDSVYQLQLAIQDDRGSARILTHYGGEGDENLVHMINELLCAPSIPNLHNIDRSLMKYQARAQLDQHPRLWQDIALANDDPSPSISAIRDALQWGACEIKNDVTEYSQLMFFVNWKLDINQHLNLLDCEKRRSEHCTCSGTCGAFAKVIEARQIMYTYRVVMTVFAWVLKVVGSGAFDALSTIESPRARFKLWRQNMNLDVVVNVLDILSPGVSISAILEDSGPTGWLRYTWTAISRLADDLFLFYVAQGTLQAFPMWIYLNFTLIMTGKMVCKPNECSSPLPISSRMRELFDFQLVSEDL